MTAGPVARARATLASWRERPNPILVRELTQAVRLPRTPAILCALTILVTLLLAAVGGVVTNFTSPARTGFALFQVYFSVAYFVVTVVGPAVAANTIASEREGRTWEALLLTGVRPEVVARGKFLAAYVSVGLYVVMLAPVGALPFLFGGVTALETLAAFAVLFVIAFLSVAFGLALSSKLESLRGAIVLTLLLAFPLASMVFTSLGVSASFLVHDVFHGVPRGAPVWLPVAFARAEFGVRYLAYLVGLPLLAVALPAWFLHEITVANLTSVTDDRSFGVKRFHAVAVTLLSVLGALALLALRASRTKEPGMMLLALLFAGLVFEAFVLAGDAIGPSRRVVLQWERMGAGRLRRFLGPGIARSMTLQLVLGGGGLALLAGVSAAILASHRATQQALDVLAFGGYAAAFLVFVVGFMGLLRARGSTPFATRVVTAAVLFGAAVGPFVVAAIVGALGDFATSRDALVIAAPSPFFALSLVERSRSDPSAFVAVVAASGAWLLAGLVLVLRARARCGEVIAAHARSLAEADARLAAEDEAARAAREEPTADTEPREEPA